MAAALTACSSSSATTSHEVTETDGTEIIGGTLATALYPEAAYVDIDLTASGGYACSGVLVAPKVLLTAGHCVDGHSTWDVTVAGQRRTSRSGITYDWKENGSQLVNPAHHDLGLVFLDAPITLAVYPTIAASKLPDGSKVFDVGRVLDGQLTNQLYGAPNEVSDATSVGYPLDYVAKRVIQAGDSGGPVFQYGTHRVVAINSGAGGSIEVLARVDLLHDWILGHIASHGGGGAPAESVDAGAAPALPETPTHAPTCSGAKETEANDAFSTAAALGAGTTCGSLASASDEDWYLVFAAAGTISLELATSGDARFSVGVVSGGQCAPSLAGLRKLTLGSVVPQELCVRVASPTKAAQPYELSWK